MASLVDALAARLADLESLQPAWRAAGAAVDSVIGATVGEPEPAALVALVAAWGTLPASYVELQQRFNGLAVYELRADDPDGRGDDGSDQRPRALFRTDARDLAQPILWPVDYLDHGLMTDAFPDAARPFVFGGDSAGGHLILDADDPDHPVWWMPDPFSAAARVQLAPTFDAFLRDLIDAGLRLATLVPGT